MGFYAWCYHCNRCGATIEIHAKPNDDPEPELGQCTRSNCKGILVYSGESYEKSTSRQYFGQEDDDEEFEE